ALFAKTELATAMPKSGGAYFFVDRSMGPFFGTFAGFASWFSLSLKTAFAILGIGVVLAPHFGNSQEIIKTIATSFAVFFCIINIISVKHTSRLQIALVIGLITILSAYILVGLGNIDVHNYSPFLPEGGKSIFLVAGIIFVSFGGLTKIASVAEEIKDPGKTIPKGMFSAFIIVTILYILTVFVTIGILSPQKFSQTLTPLSMGAEIMAGRWGFIVLESAALMAFMTTGNGGLLAASRNPLAMARDNLLPDFISTINPRTNTPITSIVATTLFIVICIQLLNLEQLVKVASTMKLLLFAFVNFSLIIMRESKISTYRPKFKSPFYPWIQIAGIFFYILIILNMGSFSLILTGGFILISLIWFLVFSGFREKKDSAIIHIVKRVTSKELQTDTLSEELKDILLARDNIIEDRFDLIIKNAKIIDMPKAATMDELFTILAEEFSTLFEMEEEKIKKLIYQREKESTTVIHTGLAIPHIIIGKEERFEIVVVRSKEGIAFPGSKEPVHTVFSLAGSKDERNFHLQALMAIAQIVQNPSFQNNWNKAKNINDLRHTILLGERVRKGDI
ncbi:MAG: amino acid permease, partial [Spirochaetales bacterium]|nr:amino acid permease [Spirochaetales bacterium]